MTDHPAASLIINCARPDGLVLPLECAARQDFQEPWELLVVNWGFGEQDELLRTLWARIAPPGRLAPTVPLRHVPPLAPLPTRGDRYGSWDMGTTYNTAWTHAQGEVSVFIEDFWVFRQDWLRLHVEFVRKHPQSFCMGTNHGMPLLDEAAPLHYGVDAVIMLNFSHRTALAWAVDGLGAPEWPTRHPESTILPCVFRDHGHEVERVPGAHAWHQPHYPDGAFGHVMQKRSYVYGEAYAHPDGTSFDGVFRYHEVERMNNGVAYIHPPPDDWKKYRRNVRDERKALGHWT